jgi:hypothetical protein
VEEEEEEEEMDWWQWLLTKIKEANTLSNGQLIIFSIEAKPLF